jgi:RNA polymerase sigma factor (TIGR02999 family)
MSDVTVLLEAAGRGDPHAGEQLLPLVYQELRRLAAQKLAAEEAGHTLQPTALVHEAYLRLVGKPGAEPHWNGRGHFFAAAAEAMRRILVERARRKQRAKHGGGWRRVDLKAVGAGEAPPDLLLAVNEALTKFAAQEPVKAELVKLRFFGGMTTTEAADALGVSRATAERHWAFARAWLFAELEDEGTV